MNKTRETILMKIQAILEVYGIHWSVHALKIVAKKTYDNFHTLLTDILKLALKYRSKEAVRKAIVLIACSKYSTDSLALLWQGLLTGVMKLKEAVL